LYFSEQLDFACGDGSLFFLGGGGLLCIPPIFWLILGLTVILRAKKGRSDGVCAWAGGDARLHASHQLPTRVCVSVCAATTEETYSISCHP